MLSQESHFNLNSFSAVFPLCALYTVYSPQDAGSKLLCCRSLVTQTESFISESSSAAAGCKTYKLKTTMKTEREICHTRVDATDGVVPKVTHNLV